MILIDRGALTAEQEAELQALESAKLPKVRATLAAAGTPPEEIQELLGQLSDALLLSVVRPDLTKRGLVVTFPSVH